MRRFTWFAVALCCALAVLGVAPASAERKVALVIGNSLYGHYAALPNVPNDAASMSALLKAAGFDRVDVRLNLGIAAVRGALRDFAGEVATADVAVLFYAGHGIEVGGTNYLIPVDARLATDYDVKDETVELDRVLEAMAPAKRLRLVILDACRENPFVKGMKRTVAGRDVGRGLGRFEPPANNTLIAFATKPNAIALDGKGPNSPFTAALLKHLLTPGLDLRIAFGHVRDEVLAGTASKQEPYVTGSLGGGVVSMAPRPPIAPASDAATAWAAAKESPSIVVLEEFRRQYGASDTFYDRLAEVRIEELKRLKLALARHKRKGDATRFQVSTWDGPIDPRDKNFQKFVAENKDKIVRITGAVSEPTSHPEQRSGTCTFGYTLTTADLPKSDAEEGSFLGGTEYLIDCYWHRGWYVSGFFTQLEGSIHYGIVSIPFAPVPDGVVLAQNPLLVPFKARQ